MSRQNCTSQSFPLALSPWEGGGAAHHPSASPQPDWCRTEYTVETGCCRTYTAAPRSRTWPSDRSLCWPGWRTRILQRGRISSLSSFNISSETVDGDTVAGWNYNQDILFTCWMKYSYSCMKWLLLIVLFYFQIISRVIQMIKSDIQESFQYF